MSRLLILPIVLMLVLPVFAETTYSRKVSLGGKLATGNTRLESTSFDFSLNRDRKLMDETNIKGRFDREYTDGLETLYKIYSAARYARSFNERFYNYYKLELEHDRFQDIDFRYLPTVGFGYWFAMEKDYKSMLEAALGYQRETLISTGGSSEQMLLTVSSNLDRGPFSNDLDVYIAANDFGNFRLTNLAKLTAHLNSFFAFKLTIKEEFNNQPAAGVDKNDLSITTALEYSVKETVKE